MIKRLLRKIFFWDEPAKGAFFGLTLFFTLPWLLLVWIFHNGRIPLAWLIWLVTGTLWDVSAVAIPIGVTLLCFLYALFLGWHGSGRHVHWHLKPQKADVFGYLAIIAASGAIFVLYVILMNLRFETAYTLREHEIYDTDIAQRLGIYGNAWGWFALLGLVLWISAYLLGGKAQSIIVRMNYRKLFGKGVFSLWGLVVVSYLFCLAMAFRANSDYRRSVEELSEYFGRPMTAVALGEDYYGGRKPDAAFWNRLQDLKQEASDKFIVKVDGKELPGNTMDILVIPDALMDDDVYAQWKAYLLGNENIRQLEAMLGHSLPPAERDFCDDKYLSDIQLEELAYCGKLERLELWRLRLAIESDDIVLAQRAWRNMENICDYLKTEPFLLGSLFWIESEHFRMQALKWFIPWDKIEPEWLEAQAVKLAEVEGRIALAKRRAIYGEAVTHINKFRVFLAMDEDVADRPLVKLTALRWFFPQIWWWLTNEAADMLKEYKSDELPKVSQDIPVDNFLKVWFSPAFDRFEKKFSQLAAHSRIMRGLIDAELRKRRTGRYPEQLDTLEDPFRKQPLKYKIGRCEIKTVTLTPVEENDSGEFGEDDSDKSPHFSFNVKEEIKNVEAVQIWSVGPDGIDDGGMSRKRNYETDERSMDDIRHIILIR